VSVVALGALLARRPLVSLAAARDAMAGMLESRGLAILGADLAALEAGFEAAEAAPGAAAAAPEPEPRASELEAPARS
jgi:hypothetical protein